MPSEEEVTCDTEGCENVWVVGFNVPVDMEDGKEWLLVVRACREHVPTMDRLAVDLSRT